MAREHDDSDCWRISVDLPGDDPLMIHAARIVVDWLQDAEAVRHFWGFEIMGKPIVQRLGNPAHAFRVTVTVAGTLDEATISMSVSRIYFQVCRLYEQQAGSMFDRIPTSLAFSALLDRWSIRVH